MPGMPKRLVLLNVVLLAVAGATAAYIVREVSAPLPRPLAQRPHPEPATAPPALPAEAAPRVAPGAYTAVVSKNLFSPTRTETPPVATAQAGGRPVPPPVKPNLQGVVVREGAPIAYLEDPTTKRVAGYRLGDSIAGATVQAIHPDRVVLSRPDGPMDVRLHDPSKPRPAVPPTAMQQLQPVPQIPGAVPQGVPPTPAVQPGYPMPQGSPVPRRSFPPSVLRRIPPTTSDAARQ